MILIDPQARPVVAHRGNRAFAPENTLEALRQAVDCGADALEFDVRVTNDGEVVLMHDPTVNRTTNGTGLVESMSLSELRRLDAGARFVPSGNPGTSSPVTSYRGRGVTVPTLHEVIDAVPGDMPLLIELKTPAASEPVRKIIRDRNLASRVLVAGFDRRAVHPLRGAGFPVGAASADAMDLLWPALLGRSVTAAQFDALCIPPTWRGVPVPIRLLVRALRGTRKVVHIWTVNDAADAQRLWRLGVQGIVTDDPGLILAARRGVA